MATGKTRERGSQGNDAVRRGKRVGPNVMHACGQGHKRPPHGVMEDHLLEVDGLNLPHMEWGSPDRPALVLHHGLGGFADARSDVTARFSAEFHVVAMDARGYGFSDWDARGRYRIDDFSGDVERVGCPTLGLRAGLHPNRSRAVDEKMIEANPLVSVIEIRDATHDIHVSHFDAFVARLAEFLDMARFTGRERTYGM